MKAKLLFILLSVLFVIPIEATTLNNKKRNPRFRRISIKEHRTARSALDFISVNDENNMLQILFWTPLPDAEITVTDKDGNIVISESQTSIYEGKMLYIYTPDAYPYIIEINSPVMDVVGEIVIEEF